VADSTLGALAIALAALAGTTGQALADDDDEVVTYGPNACTTVTDLPIPVSATCIKHKTELDDGVTETKNSYVTQTSAASVQQSFVAVFAANGWTIVEADQDLEDQEWEYTIVKPGRSMEVKVEAQEPDEGTGTEFSVEE
jgi:hypothetical protein